jgi:ssRNA-specific RNase YbeY (16S rRNA maturation enzyme)
MAVFFNCSKKFLPVLNLRLLHRQATSIMKLASLSKYDLTVDFVGNSGIQVLNQRYRNIDAPTDILSFPTYEVL